MPSSRLPPFDLGAPLRPFRLPEPLTGRLVGPEDYPQAQALLVAFISNGSPLVQHVAGALSALTRDLDPFGLQALAVNATTSDAAEETPAAVASEALRRGYIFPYLIDQTGAVARTYRVRRTPDFYVFDRARRLVHHGPFVEAGIDGTDLSRVISRVLKGEPAPEPRAAPPPPL
jgi:hypothetical protein